jgi:hypothetical protein
MGKSLAYSSLAIKALAYTASAEDIFIQPVLPSSRNFTSRHPR